MNQKGTEILRLLAVLVTDTMFCTEYTGRLFIRGLEGMFYKLPLCFYVSHLLSTKFFPLHPGFKNEKELARF